jgi:hypothetical protein
MVRPAVLRDRLEVYIAPGRLSRGGRGHVPLMPFQAWLVVPETHLQLSFSLA